MRLQAAPSKVSRSVAAPVTANAAADEPYRALPCSWWAYGITSGGLELDFVRLRCEATVRLDSLRGRGRLFAGS